MKQPLSYYMFKGIMALFVIFFIFSVYWYINERGEEYAFFSVATTYCLMFLLSFYKVMTDGTKLVWLLTFTVPFTALLFVVYLIFRRDKIVSPYIYQVESLDDEELKFKTMYKVE
ncbi:hypothetical protein [Vibrio sp. NTOU-M3]|uniref:hypothetical protein n=1 Tax=unclassified Vibrio TaxID=2614977 RepID=UPI00349F67D8